MPQALPCMRSVEDGELHSLLKHFLEQHMSAAAGLSCTDLMGPEYTQLPRLLADCLASAALCNPPAFTPDVFLAARSCSHGAEHP